MNPDMTAIAAFQAKEAEYAQRVSDLEAATAERDNVSLLAKPACVQAGDHGTSDQFVHRFLQQ